MKAKKSMKWTIAITDDNRIATIEEFNGLTSESVEDELLVIGVLDNLKQKHLNKLNSHYSKTIRRKNDEEI